MKGSLKGNHPSVFVLFFYTKLLWIIWWWTFHRGWASCGSRHDETVNFWLSITGVQSGREKNKQTKQKKAARFLAEYQLSLIRPCRGSTSAPALMLHTPCSQGFIAKVLSVSSRSYTSTEVAAGVKAAEKVKPGRHSKRTKEEETEAGSGPGTAARKQRRLKKIKSPEDQKRKKNCLGQFNIYENWSLLSAAVE